VADGVTSESPATSAVSASGAENLVPASAGPPNQIHDPAQRLDASPGLPRSDRPSIAVDTLSERSVAKHGITGREIERLNGAAHFMEKHCPRWGRLYFLSLNKATGRPVIADVQKRITRMQKGLNLPPYSVWVFEARGGLHAHILFIGDRDGSIMRRLHESQVFGPLVHIRPIYDLQGLISRYLSKERTPQAGYRRHHVLGGRIKGSHQLEGGGDRVRLSRELERDAIDAGYVEPWQHTNARRSTVRKPYSPRRLHSVPTAPRHAHPAASIRSAKSSLNRARASTAKLAQSAKNLHATLDIVDATSHEIESADKELRSELDGVTNAGPPMDDAPVGPGHPPSVARGKSHPAARE
jgi:hypothetical protein